MQLWQFIFKPTTFIVLIAIITMYFLFMKYSETFKLVLNIIKNAFKILFKKHKKIEKNELHYFIKSVFANSYFIIKFNFENAIWFQFKGITTKSRSGEIVFNLENLKQKEIILIVQGFFRKKVYKIELLPVLELNTENFKLQLHYISNASKKTNLFPLKLIERVLKFKSRFISIKRNVPIVKKQSIDIKLTAYNQNNFL